jgi:hypothetical protein
VQGIYIPAAGFSVYSACPMASIVVLHLHMASTIAVNLHRCWLWCVESVYATCCEIPRVVALLCKAYAFLHPHTLPADIHLPGLC